jgi:predicted nuclease of restriction endonuclease-like RecB superfamily
MLTADMVRVRRNGARIRPAFLKSAAFDQLAPLADLLIETFAQHEGSSVDELHAALEEISAAERDRVRVLGLIKILEDTCEIDDGAGADADRVRATVFRIAAARRRALDLRQPFDRSAVLAEAATHLGRTPDDVDRALFADLPGAQRILRFPRTTATALLHRYNLALAQGVLLRATRVVLDIEPAPPTRYRELFHAIRFRRLMADISGDADHGYRIVLDGPMSLFESTQRYGLQLALFLPVVVAGDGWTLSADVVWGKTRERLTMELSDRDGLVSNHRGGAGELEEIAALEAAFARLDGPWVVRRNAGIFELKGKGVFMPDLVFEHSQTRKCVYLEAFGYWSREAVFRRVELLQQGFDGTFLLAVSRKLRVSPEVAGEDFPGRILVYTGSIPVHAVRRALDELGGS